MNDVVIYYSDYDIRQAKLEDEALLDVIRSLKSCGWGSSSRNLVIECVAEEVGQALQRMRALEAQIVSMVNRKDAA